MAPGLQRRQLLGNTNVDHLGYACAPTVNFHSGHIAPNQNDGSNIFVFGANLAGRHGRGAAKEACLSWGAVYGCISESGEAYGIPTKDKSLRTLPLDKIQYYVEIFLDYAAENPQNTFLVTRIGCGLAGYTDAEIAPMFSSSPDNVLLPPEWKSLLRR